MILKLDILYINFVLSVYADINITTEYTLEKSLHQQGMDIHNSTSIYLKVKNNGTAWISLQENSSSTNYEVYKVFLRLDHITINNKLEKQYTSVTWSELQCNCYVSLWVSWIGGTIEVGEGSEIGTNKLIHLPINDSIFVTDILIRSYTTAYWLFDFLENATSARTTDGTDGVSGIDPGTINKTETTLPGFVSTTTGKIETTTSGLDLTLTNTTETATSGFSPSSINTTETTTPGFYPTYINTTASRTPGLYLTSTNTTETTTPGFVPTTISETETTTQEFAPISIDMVTATTSGTTKSIETTSTTTSCICPCYNSTLTDDVLITKIALLRSELFVDPKLTSKYKRSLISAADHRASSMYIGTFGIVVLVVICTLIVLMDLQHCARFIFQKKK